MSLLYNALTYLTDSKPQKITFKIFRCLYRWCPPLPIPNREVKPTRADGTAVTRGRVGRCQILSKIPCREIYRVFLFIHPPSLNMVVLPAQAGTSHQPVLPAYAGTSSQPLNNANTISPSYMLTFRC
jgi:hypothetical protein